MLEIAREQVTAPDRIVVLDNPFSKNGHRGRRQLEDLQEFSGLHLEWVETSPDPDETAGRLDILEPTDLLYVIGGDGTNNPTIEPLMRSGAVTLPTRSGNANDLSNSANGQAPPWRVYSDYLEGEAAAVEVRPIEVTVMAEGEVATTSYANNYASFGYAALASHLLNQPLPDGFRRMIAALPAQLRPLARIPLEGYQLLKAAKLSQPFGYREAGGDNFHRVADVTVVHSERMAKLGRFDVRHSDEHMFGAVLEKGGMLAMGLQFGRMMRGKMSGGNVVGTRTFEVNNESGQPIYLQVDGEASRLPDSSRVSVGLSQDHIRVLSTRLHNRAA